MSTNILLVQLGEKVDIINTFPVVEDVVAQSENISVYILVTHGNEDIASCSETIKEVLVLPGNHHQNEEEPSVEEYATSFKGIANKFLKDVGDKATEKAKEVKEMATLLRGKEFDIVLDLTGTSKSAMLARGIKSNMSCGFDEDHTGDPKTSMIYNKTYPVDADMSAPEKYRVLASKAMGEYELPPIQYGTDKAEQLIEAAQTKIVVAPGESVNPAAWNEIAEKLRAANIEIILARGSMVSGIAADIVQPHAVMSTGEMDCLQLLTLMESAGCVITDGSSAYLAVAASVPAVVFGELPQNDFVPTEEGKDRITVVSIDDVGGVDSDSIVSAAISRLQETQQRVEAKQAEAAPAPAAPAPATSGTTETSGNDTGLDAPKPDTAPKKGLVFQLPGKSS